MLRLAHAQAKLYPRVLAAMKPGATLGLSHGFLLGVMQNDGVDFREDINVILNAPKVRPLRHMVPLPYAHAGKALCRFIKAPVGL